jgi:hypothetical protein
MANYVIYTQRHQVVLETSDPTEALTKVRDTRGSYLVTDGQGPREGKWPTARHHTHGVYDRQTCVHLLDDIGGYVVGSTIGRRRSDARGHVVHVGVGKHSRIPWSPWSVTLVDFDHPGQTLDQFTPNQQVVRSRTHCTRWDAKDKIVHLVAE